MPKAKKKKKTAYVAQRFVAPEGAEVLGASAAVFFDNLASHQLDPVLAKHGFTQESFDPQAWYPLQFLLDLADEANPNDDHVIGVALGKALAQRLINMLNVPDAQTFVEVSLNQVQEVVNRNIPEEFGYQITKIDEGHYLVHNNTPFSNNGIYGYLWEAMRILVGTEGTFSVRLTEDTDFDAATPATFEVTFSP